MEHNLTRYALMSVFDRGVVSILDGVRPLMRKTRSRRSGSLLGGAVQAQQGKAVLELEGFSKLHASMLLYVLLELVRRHVVVQLLAFLDVREDKFEGTHHDLNRRYLVARKYDLRAYLVVHQL